MYLSLLKFYFIVLQNELPRKGSNENKMSNERFCTQKIDCISEYEFATMPKGSDGLDAVTKCETSQRCSCHSEFRQLGTNKICTKSSNPKINIRIEAVWDIPGSELLACEKIVTADNYNEKTDFLNLWIGHLSGEIINRAEHNTSTILCSPFRGIKSVYFKVGANDINAVLLNDRISGYLANLGENPPINGYDFQGTPAVTFSFGTPYCPVFPPATRAALFGGVCQISECETGYSYDREFRLGIEPHCVLPSSVDDIVFSPEPRGTLRAPDGSIDDQFIKAAVVLFIIIGIGTFVQLFTYFRSSTLRFRKKKTEILEEFDKKDKATAEGTSYAAGTEKTPPAGEETTEPAGEVTGDDVKE